MKIDQQIGKKIAILRDIKKIELPQLAALTGLNPTQIEEIESGISLPSLGVLIRITRAMGIRLGTLLDDNAKAGPAITRKEDISNATDSFSTGNTQSREHLTFHSLASHKTGRHMEPFIIDIAPMEISRLPKSSHEGEEFIFVMEGSIDVFYGNKEFTIEKGESIYLDSVVEHLVTTHGNEPAKVLTVIYIPV
ncbi:XRE family transcriptional regulator [Breznakibacter xylanolyticus]|uniref:XRE family transcriptional regulator n=1 Tax=Breznakibacter xylanolyticus TaxID=990 RepID=A0A2W7N1Z3_9BACT|nr:XRE family transcriptional regulator [Breznakibacter xylanolyticus]MBN2745036.1 helix-turn-helix transcriptional regulator [Marinilabiliaceae bacterium]PZX13713.1 XRE family transcriptional regulator [Breznakibacter xylanolyticus]